MLQIKTGSKTRPFSEYIEEVKRDNPHLDLDKVLEDAREARRSAKHLKQIYSPQFRGHNTKLIIHKTRWLIMHCVPRIMTLPYG
jgi:hypothetical protein